MVAALNALVDLQRGAPADLFIDCQRARAVLQRVGEVSLLPEDLVNIAGSSLPYAFSSIPSARCV